MTTGLEKIGDRKLLNPIIIGWIIAGLLGPLNFWILGLDSQALSQTTSEVLRLRTDGLPLPLVLPEDPDKRSITSLEIQGELRGEEDGKGTMTLDESTLVFNEFGDATKVRAKAAEPSQVVFRQVKQSEKSEKRRLYEIVFADGSFPKRMYLLLSAGIRRPHRLLIHDGNRPVQNRMISLAHVLDLHGLPAIKELIPDVPLHDHFRLSTMSSSHGRTGGRLRRVAVSGSPNGRAHLTLDPNYMDFNAFGDVVTRTMMGSRSIMSTLNPVDIPDPAKKGRLLFEIMPEAFELPNSNTDIEARSFKPASYRLVLSPTEAGAHRLLIKEGGVLRHVLPLQSGDFRSHLWMQAYLAETSASEQQAIAELRNAIGYRFNFKVESGAVVGLLVRSRDDADHIDTTLKYLKNLRLLEFSGSRLNAVGLPSLRYLAKLEKLTFSFAHIHDAGLASIKHLTQLRELTFKSCERITDKGIVHLGGLKNLKSLNLNRGDSSVRWPNPKAVTVTDAGLEHLKGLTKLEGLDLIGHKITDVGLRHLKDLTNLKALQFSGDGITDAGLEHLNGLVRLKYLRLFKTSVTPTGEAALRSKLPMLRIGH